MKMIGALLPFWLFALLFKFGAGLHYTLLSALGTRILPVWIVGLLIGGASFIQLVLDVPAGFLLDRFGYVRILRITTFVFLLATATLLFGLTPLSFALTLLLGTCGWLFFGPGSNAYMLVRAPWESAGVYLGFFHAVRSLGVVFATLCLIFVVDASPLLIGMLLSFILLIALISICLTPKERETVHKERKIIRHTYYIRRHFLPHLLKALRKLNPASTLLMLQNLAGSIFYASIWFTIPIILAAGIGDRILGVGMATFDAAVVVLGLFLGKLSDRADQKKLVFFGLLIFAVAGTMLGFNLNIWFIVLGFLATAGDEMSAVSLWNWLDRLDKKHNEDGLINGAIVLAEDIGWTIGPIFAGLLYNLVGPKWTIVAAALPIFLVWLISIILTRHHVQAPSPIPERHPHKFRHKH